MGLAGSEKVVDVGCGRGLLLVGVARRLRDGRAFGVDLWQSIDQSGNTPEATMANAKAEDVAGRVEIRTADMRDLPFHDESMDCGSSSIAIHNVPGEDGRAKAIREIARVLKPGAGSRYRTSTLPANTSRPCETWGGRMSSFQD